MTDHGWIERVVRALLVSGAEIDHERREAELRQRVARARLRFETLLSLVNAQTIESGAMDATLGVALAGLIAVMFPLSERAHDTVARAAVGLMIIPALSLAYGLFGIRTDSPRAVLAEELIADNLQSITSACRALSRGHELNREYPGGKRALLRFAIRISAVLLVLWATPMAWRFVVVQ